MKLIRCLLLMLLLSAAPFAQAKRGLLIFNTGDELFEVGAFPTAVIEADPEIKDKGLIVASFCKHFGVLWADVWTWDCKLVGSQPSLDSYYDLPGEIGTAVATQYKISDAKRGFWNKYAFWVLIIAAGGFMLFGALTRKEETAEEAA